MYQGYSNVSRSLCYHEWYIAWRDKETILYHCNVSKKPIYVSPIYQGQCIINGAYTGELNQPVCVTLMY